MITALYRRVSTQEQAEGGYSVDEQLSRLEKYAASMSWSPVRDYCDPGFSGASLDRPGIKKLIRDCKAGRIDRVVVWKLDRLSRSQRDTLYLIEDVFLANKIAFVSMSENFDTGSAFGRAMISILSVFAQLEREQIRERTELGRVARIKDGRYNGGNPAIGYKLKDGELVPDDFDAPLIRRVFNLYLEGKSPYAIAAEMNDAGLQHRTAPWTPDSVREALRREVYIGRIVYRGASYPGRHPAIITPDVWEQAQAMHERRSRESHEGRRPYGRVTSRLGGLLRCELCGGNYCHVTRTSHGKHGQTWSYDLYVCENRSGKNRFRLASCKNKNWKETELEALVFGEIKKLATDPRRKNKKCEKPADLVGPLQREVERIDRQISRLLDVYSVSTGAADLIQNKIRDLAERKNKLEDQILEESSPKKALSREEAIVISGTFADVLAHGNHEEIRAVVVALIDHISIDQEDVSIFWRFS